MRQNASHARELEAALSRGAGGKVRRRLRAAFYSDPPSVTAAKSLDFLTRRTKGSTPPSASKASTSGVHAGASELAPLARERRTQVLDRVCEALRAHGATIRWDANDRWAYVAVREEDLAGVHAAIQSLVPVPDGRYVVWLGSGARYSKARGLSQLSMSELVESDSCVVGIPYRHGTYTLGREGGVEILIVEPRDARLVARRTRAEKADWTADFAQRTDDLAIQSREVTSGTDGVVDVVYTWVDSSDAEWMRQREMWRAQSDDPMESATSDERYLDRDELLYSLRSIWAYAPFVRNIYIVTQGHRPAWLVDDNDRMRIVSHEEIFPDTSVLPTFNSHAIEACLHRIPGLAENFLYFNDDVFLGREVARSDFFTKAGLTKCRFSTSAFVSAAPPGAEATPTDWASFNAARMVLDDFGIQFDRKLKHVPHPMKRSVLEDLERRYPHIFDETRASRFRERTDFAIPSMLAQYFGIATRQSVEWAHIPGEYMYADTGQDGFQAKLQQVVKTRPKFFCLNVTRETDIALDAQAGLLREFLSRRYPIPSPFEVKDREG